MRDLPHAKGNSTYLYKEHFDGFDHLRDRKYARAIELGCGPITNIRLMNTSDMDEIHLLDPLLDKFLDHPECTFKGGNLRVQEGRFRKVPVVLHTSTVEEFQTDKRFDLIVLIDVIEHCLDLDQVFSKILEIANPGCVFVYYDKHYNIEEVTRQTETNYDAGHPLRVDKKLILEFLEDNFTLLLQKVNHTPHYKLGKDLSFDALYYIGRRT